MVRFGEKGGAMLCLFYFETPVINKASHIFRKNAQNSSQNKVLKNPKISFLFNAIPVI